MKNGLVLFCLFIAILFSYSCAEDVEPQEVVDSTGPSSTGSETPTPESEIAPAVIPTPAVYTNPPLPAEGAAKASPTQSTGSTGVENMSLDNYQALIKNRNGKPLFVNYWATWCGPCMSEMPHIQEMFIKYADKMDFLALSVDNFSGTAKAVPQKVQQLKLTLPVKILEEPDQEKVIKAINPNWGGQLPLTQIYDSQGNRVKQLLGGQSKETFEQVIQTQLASGQQ